MKIKIKTPVSVDNINNRIIGADGEVVCHTTTAEHNLVIAAALNEFVNAGLLAARRVGKLGGRPSAFSRPEVREKTRELVIAAKAEGRDVCYKEIATEISKLTGVNTTDRSVRRFVNGV